MKRKALKMRLTAAAAAAAMIFAAGCGSGGEKPAETTAASSQAETKAPVKVTLPPKSNAETEAPKVVVDGVSSEDIPYTPAMWKATSPDGREMYMMGSMHALDDSCYPLPDYVQQAYDSCGVLAVECDLTSLTGSAAQLKYSGKTSYPKGETIKDHLSAETWEKLSGYFEHYGLDPADYETYSTWGLYSSIQRMTMSDTGLASDKGFDRYLLKNAHADGKEVFEVESMDEQLSMLAGFSDKIYDLLLADYSAENADAITQSNLALFKAWKTGDTDWIESNSGTDISKFPEDVRAEAETFINAMYLDRNAHMESDAKQLLAGDKPAFFVVGLAHFLGEKGIIDLLEKDGYTVERLH